MCSLSCVQIIGYIMASKSYSFVCILRYFYYHHYVDSSESTERIKWLLCMSCRVCPFSHLSFMQFMGLSVFSLAIFHSMIVRTSVLHLTIIKAYIWIISHLEPSHETTVYGVRLAMFLYVCIQTLWATTISIIVIGSSQSIGSNMVIYFKQFPSVIYLVP